MGITYKAQGMKCLLHFRTTSMKEDTSAHLSGRGELDRGAYFDTCTLSFKRVVKMIEYYSSLLPTNREGLAWIK